MRRWWIDDDRLGEAARAYIERDVEDDQLAAAILRCKLISLGFDETRINRLIAEYGRYRRFGSLP